MTAKLDFSKPDVADEDELNEILWKAAKGEEAYPTEFSGAHGKGLPALKLKLVGPQRTPGPDDDDDDD